MTMLFSVFYSSMMIFIGLYKAKFLINKLLNLSFLQKRQYCANYADISLLF